MPTRKRKLTPTTSGEVTASRPLSALLSQTLVAYTLEFDNEFERRMMAAGYPGSSLSLVVWLNLMRFLVESAVSVQELGRKSFASETGSKFQLGCLERWRLVELQPDSADDRPVATRLHRLKGRVLRDGWGSGRGIRAGWFVCLTKKGRTATEIWSPLLGEIDRRWQNRFGRDSIGNLQQTLAEIVHQLDLDLPHGLPMHWNEQGVYPKLEAPRTVVDAIPVLVSQLLLAFTLEFERESRVPLVLCANTLRVLGQTPVRLSDLPHLTGISPEASDIGWQGKPYVAVAPDPTAKRGKVATLTPLGRKVQQNYYQRIHEIEQGWETQFGRQKVERLRGCLQSLFTAQRDDRPLMAEGLTPAEGTIRSGAEAPALGRRDVGAAARQRMRDLVAQTERFVRDPAHALPHYPAWDMNRGFGP